AGSGMTLDAEPDREVRGEGGDGADAVRQARQLRPDVVVMDIRMPVQDGIAATAEIAAAGHARVLVLTTFHVDEHVVGALRAGASGVLLKDAHADRLLEAIRVVHAGDAIVDPAVTRKLLDQFVHRLPAPGEAPAAASADRLAGTTGRGREVLALVARGLSNAEIAAELVVTETTVKTHVPHPPTKPRARDRGQRVGLGDEAGRAGQPPPTGDRLGRRLDPGVEAQDSTVGRCPRRAAAAVFLTGNRTERNGHDYPDGAGTGRARGQPQQDLRRRPHEGDGAGSGITGDRLRLVHRHHGTVRVRQVHAHALHGGPGQRRRRAGLDRRPPGPPAARPGCAATASASSSRPTTCCPPSPRRTTSPSRWTSRAAPPTGPGSTASWARWAWRRGCGTAPRNCPAGSSSGLPSRGPWPAGRRSSSRTSPP